MNGRIRTAGWAALLLLVVNSPSAFAWGWWPDLPYKPGCGCPDDYCPKAPPCVPPLACRLFCDDYDRKAPPAPPCRAPLLFPDDYCAKPPPPVPTVCPGPLSTCGSADPGQCGRPKTCVPPWPNGPRTAD